MYTQREMGRAKKEADNAHGRIKRMGLKNAYVTFYGDWGDMGAELVDRDARDERLRSIHLTSEERADIFHTEDFKRRQDKHRRQETEDAKKQR